jgi:hypothetical protein
VAHDVRFDQDTHPAQVNTGEESFTLVAGTSALGGTLFYWIDHTLQPGVGDEAGEIAPMSYQEVMLFGQSTAPPS